MRYSKVIHYAPLALAVGAALAYLALYLLNVLYSPPGVGANTAPSGTYNLYEIGDDEIWNWDFESTSTGDDNVDWSMRFVFGDNATINEVKHRIDGQAGDPSISPELDVSGSAKKAWVDDGDEQTGSEWDSDEGKKEGNHCDYGNHMRFYAQSGEDRNYNSTWEYYIVATLHDQSLDLGEIAKPEDIAETDVDPAGATFEITADYSGISIGDEIYYIGRTGGWQTAEVIDTCSYASFLHQVRIICIPTARVTGDSDDPAGGDSGAPVIKPGTGNNVKILGTLFAGGYGEYSDEFDFSPIGNIYMELGLSSVWDTCVAGC